MRRLFAAIPVTPAQPLLAMMIEGKAVLHHEHIRWAQPERMHLTLKFFGEVPEKEIPVIIRHLKEHTEKTQVFHFLLQGTGMFGSRYQPKVLWAGTAGDAALHALGEQVIDASATCGFPRERLPFVPHLTLARIAGLTSVKRFHEFLASHRDDVFQEAEVDKMILYESILHTTGAEHIALREFPLQLPAI
jgi:RNA 2',3'-cyclic 3'-phosphodiesterase